MRAMPSPTDSTLPTSLTSASLPKLAIWSLMTLEISAARMSISSLSHDGDVSPSALHHLREGIEPAADRAVDPLGADGDDEPAEQVGVDAGLQFDGAALAGAEPGLQRRQLLVGEGVGAGDLGGDLAALGG